ncbi:hypothetical protein AB5I41_09495 [Sphingomonas sp. MMS24-JH45]
MKLLQIDLELAANRRFSTVDDRTVTVAEVRAGLRPGEAYWKLTTTGSAVYGFLATAEGSRIWRIATAAELDKLAAAVRGSVDGQLAQGKLVPFDVAGSYALFRLLTGDATDAVLASGALVIDPAGPLRALPAGLLVTTRESVDAYRAGAAKRPFDFTLASFLASRTTISTSVSPRSFLVTRALPPSAASCPLIAFGEHRPPAADGPAREVRVGFGCSRAFRHARRPVPPPAADRPTRAVGRGDEPRLSRRAGDYGCGLHRHRHPRSRRHGGLSGPAFRHPRAEGGRLGLSQLRWRSSPRSATIGRMGC